MANFYAEPYWDDFDQPNGALEQNYMRILFRPGYAVQARELTQIQSIIQNQIKQFGNHIFQDGSPVIGGHLSLDTSVTYIKVEKQFGGTDIDLENFIDLTVFNNVIPKTRARVIQTYSSGNDRVLLVKYLRGSIFLGGQTLTTAATQQIASANVVATNYTGTGSTVTINDGVFYVGGFFVKVPQQTIVLDPYSSTPTFRIGLEIDERIITDSEDSMLLDPAQESFNYQAPGAHRYKYNLVLTKRAIDSVDDSRFFELLRVENGVITRQVSYPIYSELEKTLARRTYDESGNYAVKPFRINLSANTTAGSPENKESFILNIEPGKAYVKGFEFETIGTTKIPVARARTFKESKNYNLSVYYGNRIDLANVYGSFSGIGFSKDLEVIDIHCVPNNEVILSGATHRYYTSKIGSGRLRNFDYAGTANTFSAYLTDINFTPLVGEARRNSTYRTEVYLPLYFSSNTGAYIGATLTMLSGDSEGASAIVTRYDGTSQMAALNVELPSPVKLGDKFSLSVPMSAAKSFIIPNKTTFTSANLQANIAPTSIDVVGRATLQDTSFNKNIFELPNYYIRYDSDQNVNLHRRLIRRVTFGGGNGSYPFGLAGPDQGIFDFGADEQFVSNADILENIIVIPTTGINAGIPIDLTAPGRSVFRSTNKNITINTNSASGPLFTADVYVTVKLIDVSNTKRTKNLIRANDSLTIYDTQSLASPVFGNFQVRINSANGIAWYRTANVINKIPGEKQSLFTSDVIKIKKVYDSEDITLAPTLNSLDVTDRYILDSGQNDNYYDHASIILKPGAQPPSGQTAVLFDYYIHTGVGYLSAKSYDESLYNEEQIPLYKSETGKIYNLRDSIDLRPVRLSGVIAPSFVNVKISPTVNVVSGSTLVLANTALASNVISPPISAGSTILINNESRKVVNVINVNAVVVSTPFINTATNTNISIVEQNDVFNESYIQRPTDPFQLDYAYYLPRIDKVIVTKDKEFKVLTGVPSLAPQEPVENENSMAIYRINIPAFTASVQSVDLDYIDNRRYTMKDIATIDQRLTDLEEFVRLKESEKDIINNPPKSPSTPTINKPIYGTIVDEFNDLLVADTNNDFASSIENGRLTCYRKIDSFLLAPRIDPFISTILPFYPELRDKLITLPYNELPAISQRHATENNAEQVQTAIIGKFEGFVTLTPESDYFYSQEHQPAITDSVGRFYELKQQVPDSVSAINEDLTQRIGGNGYFMGVYNNPLLVSSYQTNINFGQVYIPNYSTNPATAEPTITTTIPIRFPGVGVETFLNREWNGVTSKVGSGVNANQFSPGWIDNGYIPAGSIGSGLGEPFNSGLYNLN